MSATLWLPETATEPSDFAPGSGTVAVCCSELARYSAFGASLAELELPDGWRVRYFTGTDIVVNRNAAVRSVLREQREHLLFLDDDHQMPCDLISRLLAHQRDIVGVLHVDRHWPLVEPPPGPPGLYEVEVVGAPGCLIHRRVLERLDPPFRHWELGTNEDYDFCARAREAGFEVWQDTSLTFTHLTTAILEPEYHPEGGWAVRVRFNGADFLIDAEPGRETRLHDEEVEA